MANLQRLIEHIRITQDDISKVSNAKENLLKVLREKKSNNEIPNFISSWIVGSYGRKTKIAPLDDVDIFIILAESDNGSYNIPNEYCNNGNHISSLLILNAIKKALSNTFNYQNSQIKRNNEVVNIFLSSYEVGFDIVPVLFDKTKNLYRIPKGSGTHDWKSSNPEKDQEIINKLNSKHNEKFKEIIKILKYWMKKKKMKNLRSYHLESICYFIFDSVNSVSSVFEGLKVFYQNISRFQNYLISCPDPTGIGENLSSDYCQDDLNNFISKCNSSLQKLNEGEEEYVKDVTPEI